MNGYAVRHYGRETAGTVRDYASATAMLATRKRKLGNNTYLAETADGPTVRLHGTNVLVFLPDGGVRFDSGGWRTVTTKDRMNGGQTVARVYSDSGVWYIAPTAVGAVAARYADGVTVYPDGRVTGAAPGGDARADLRAIRRYVDGYMAALAAGDVPAPGPGDCLGCLMVPADGSRDAPGRGFGGDHVRLHVAERYYVPSLMLRATEAYPVSQVARCTLAAAWNGERINLGTVYGDIGARQLKAALRRYVGAAFGYQMR